MPREPRKPTVISGERFIAHVSADREIADVVDERFKGALALLRANDLRELRDIAQNTLEFMGEA